MNFKSQCNRIFGFEIEKIKIELKTVDFYRMLAIGMLFAKIAPTLHAQVHRTPYNRNNIQFQRIERCTMYMCVALKWLGINWTVVIEFCKNNDADIQYYQDSAIRICKQKKNENANFFVNQCESADAHIILAHLRFFWKFLGKRLYFLLVPRVGIRRFFFKKIAKT